MATAIQFNTSQNHARQYGLTSTRMVVLPADFPEFEAFREALAAELKPEGALEQLTFDQLLRAAWNIERTHRLEQDLLANGLDPLLDAALERDLGRILRYRAAAERSYYRALKELRTLQTERATRKLKLSTEDREAMPVLAATNEVTKQTRSEVTAEALDLAVKMTNYDVERCKLVAVQREIQNQPKLTPAGKAAHAR